MKLIHILLFLLPISLFSQSEGGFGYRRFANTTTLGNVNVSNIDKSASRNAYVHSNGLYYVWDGNSWEREHDIDTLSINGTTLSISLYGDGVPVKTVNIAGAISVSGADSTWVKTNGSYANKRITDYVYRTGTIGLRTTDTTGLANFNLPNTSTKPGLNFSGTTNYLLTTSRPSTTTHNISNITFVNRLFPSASIAGDNQVLAIGFNNSPGGGLVNSSRPAASFRLEENYTNSLSDTSGNYEVHLPHIQYPNGTNVRPLTGYFSNESLSKGGYWQFNSDVLLFHNFASTQKGWLSIDTKLSYQRGLTFLDTATVVLYKSFVSGIEGRKADNSAFIRMIKTDDQDRVFLGGQNETRVAAYNILQVTNGGYIYNENGTVIIGNSTYSRSNLLIDGFSTLALGLKTSTQTSPWYFRLYDTHLTFRTPAGNDMVDLHEDAPANTIFTNSSGNIGLLTGSPQSRFHINTSNGATQSMTRFQNSVESMDLYVTNATPEGAISASPGSFAYSEISSTGRWWGKQTGTGNTGWVEFYHTGNLPASVNIFTSDGTQNAADRLFTQDSTRTFAMGQFSSVGSPTWGRGYYYDPSTTNGIRILNKNGSNTTTAMVELDPETVNIQTTHTTSSVLTSSVSLSQNSSYNTTVDRTSDTWGTLSFNALTNSNEEVITMTQTGKGTSVTNSLYLGKGYSSSQYAKYSDRAWGLQTHLSSGSFDWIQVLLPDTGTDTTGNNLSFYNRAYYFPNEAPSETLGDTSLIAWVGDGTTGGKNPVWLPYTSGINIGNSNLTTTDNTRILNVQESFQIIGSADAGLDPYPFQVISTGNEPYIQLWKGNTDSVWMKQSDVEYLFGSSAKFVVQSDDDLILQADSVSVSTVESKTTIRGLVGITSNGVLKQFDGDSYTAGAFIKSNGTDFTEGDWFSNFSSSTQNTASWTVDNANTNVNAAIVPKGTGALVAAIPDGSTTGGNSRGTNAVDLQTSRDAATQVASGNLSGLLAGRRNTASGTASALIGGADNIASGSGSVVIGGYTAFSSGGAHVVSGINSVIIGGVQDTVTGGDAVALGTDHTVSGQYAVAMGSGAKAYLQGQVAHANAKFSTDGDAQASEIIMYKQITGESETELLIGGTSQAIIPATNKVWTGTVKCTGTVKTVGNGSTIVAGDTYAKWQSFTIKRVGSSTTLMSAGTGVIDTWSDTNMGGAAFTLSADDTTEALKITFTPPTLGGTTTVCNAVCTVQLNEVGF